MILLKFFLEWGKHGLAFLWIIYIGLAAWFLYQAYKAHNSGGYQNVRGKLVVDDNKTPYVKIPQFWAFVFITGMAVVIHLAIESSYK